MIPKKYLIRFYFSQKDLRIEFLYPNNFIVKKLIASAAIPIIGLNLNKKKISKVRFSWLWFYRYIQNYLMQLGPIVRTMRPYRIYKINI